MKKIIFIAASVLFCVFSLVLSSCSDDDDAKQSVAKPVVALAEVGKENSKEAIAGKDLHFKGQVVTMRDATNEEIQALINHEGCNCGGDCEGGCGGHHHEHGEGECCGKHEHGKGECCGKHEHGEGCGCHK